MQSKNGINMMDVKMNNRSSLLNLVYHTDGISRKEIASRLGLTPAAITLIVNDLIQEGILEERDSSALPAKKGRKEVSLGLVKNHFAAIGINITKTKFRVVCIDFNQQLLFGETVYVSDCQGRSGLLLRRIADVLYEKLTQHRITRDYVLTGIGISINGIVDTAKGISIHSYYTIEDNTDIRSYFQDIFNVPVIVTNNICSVAHAECFISGPGLSEDLLLFKYGPGVGAARFLRSRQLSYDAFTAVQLGHLIMDDNGLPCICGNHGCLETIASYEAIEYSISSIMNPENAPTLWELSLGQPSSVNIQMIMQAYLAGDPVVVRTLERVIHYLALAIKNALCLFEPQTTILYGEPFNNIRFRDTLFAELSRYTNTEHVHCSQLNMRLDAVGPATTAITCFLNHGGTSPLL